MLPHQTSLLSGASSLLRARHVFSHWSQTSKPSAVYVSRASNQLKYTAWLVSSIWQISGIQFSWDYWSSYWVSLIISFFQPFSNSTAALLEFQSQLPLVINSNVESVSWINPFLPNLLLGHDVCAGIETLTKTICKQFLLQLLNIVLQTWIKWYFKQWKYIQRLPAKEGGMHTSQSQIYVLHE